MLSEVKVSESRQYSSDNVSNKRCFQQSSKQKYRLLTLIGVTFQSLAILQENLSNLFGLPYTFATLFDHKVFFKRDHH